MKEAHDYYLRNIRNTFKKMNYEQRVEFLEIYENLDRDSDPSLSVLNICYQILCEEDPAN